MAIEPVTHLEKTIAGTVEPVTHLEKVIEQYGGGGGGGSVTSVNGKTGAVTLTAADVGAAEAETVVSVSGTTPTIEPQANTIYNCGELASLTITDPGNIKYSVIFFSGATATTTVGIANFAAEPNKRYRIDVESGYATYDSWPYTPAP